MDKIFIKKTGEPKLKQRVEVDSDKNEIEYEKAYYDEDTKKFICFVTKEINTPPETFDLINSIKFAASHRASGLISSSQIFGKAPRAMMKRLSCRNCVFNTSYPKQYSLLNYLSEKISSHFEENFNEEFNQHKKSSEIVHENWRMNGGIFTSGIINNNTKLMYHTDNGNIKNCFSYMLTLKKGVVGGDLHLPEYGAVVRLKHKSFILFDGASVSHGVTPFTLLNKDSKRFTIVWYTQEQLTKCCETITEEINHMNRVFTQSCKKK